MGHSYGLQSLDILINKLGTVGLDEIAVQAGTIWKRIFRVWLSRIHWKDDRNLFGSLFWMISLHDGSESSFMSADGPN